MAVKSYQSFLSHDLTTDTSEDETDYILQDLFKHQTVKGYSVLTAAVFITSLMAGMGVLALPHALAGTGWYGLILISLACVNSWYSASILGRCWIILEERWEEYRGKFRYPYPAMGLRSIGSWMRYTVTITLNITLMGVAVVYILLSAQIAQSMMQRVISMDYSTWIIILAAILCPLTWFGSLEDFWFAAAGALLTAALVCYSLLISVALQVTEIKDIQYDNPTFSSFSLSFGTILFSFGGVFFFPTIQNDMAKRQDFNKASVLGFTGLLLLYMPITIVGYAVYGSSVPSNILFTVENNYLRMFIEASLAVHILLAFLLVLNPVAQEAEEVLKIEARFNYKRCLVRSLLVFIVLLIAYTIPHFDKIMNLIGGSTMTLLTFIFPPLFYICLNYDDNDKKLHPCNRLSTFEMIFLFQIILVGLAGGIACTYFAMKDIILIFFNREKI